MIRSTVSLDDHSGKFLTKHDLMLDLAGAKAGTDMETIIKTGGKTPFGETGHLRDGTRVHRDGVKLFRVIMDVEYAAFQERGRRLDGSHIVRRYTTPGTGKGFMADAGRQINNKRRQYLAEASRIVGLK